MNATGSIVFDNLALLLAMGVFGEIIVGLFYAVVYFFVFMIRKCTYKTPAREEDDRETKLYTRKDLEARNHHEKTEPAYSSVRSVGSGKISAGESLVEIILQVQ